jgi:prolyl 4-hydroxylase
MQLHVETHSNNDFLKGWYINDTSLCDSLIDYFENSKYKYEGKIGTTGNINKDIKDSTDCVLQDEGLTMSYLGELTSVVNQYIEVFPFVNYYAPWTVEEQITIQKYEPNQAYHGWHTERGTANNNRHMVFMTYLNDVVLGGETEFLHQQIKVKPSKGLTLLWPADWTFTHRGCPAINETKYIITGWFNYTE